MKTRISPLKMTLYVLAGILTLAICLCGMFFNALFYAEWNWLQYFLIIAFGIGAILFAIFTPLFNYYVVEKKYLVVRKYRREIVYTYSDVIYIDQKQSEKKKTICFYTKQGHCRYVMFDAKGLNYQTMLANSKNLLSDEDFHNSYPNVNL